MSLDNTPEQSQLGRASAYADQYDAGLLFPIPRAAQRDIDDGLDRHEP